MDLLSDYHKAMIKAARRVLTEHHKAAAADLRQLIKEHPLLRSVTLAEIFGLKQDDTTGEVGDWAHRLGKALARQRNQQHTYKSMHELVDRYYLEAVMIEHQSIMGAAEHLQISRHRLRDRLRLLGLYDDDST